MWNFYSSVFCLFDTPAFPLYIFVITRVLYDNLNRGIENDSTDMTRNDTIERNIEIIIIFVGDDCLDMIDSKYQL